jgi:SAM-dependent methyltransferase
MIRYILETKPMQPIKRALKTRFPKSATLAKAIVTSLEKRTQIRDAFLRIYKTNAWGGRESVSGLGSSLDQTVVLRETLPSLLRSIQATTMLDAPCGDYFWMKELSLDLELYIGVDIVKKIIDQNRRRYGGTGKQFFVKDITKDSLPRVDCILCRDCLDHLSFEDVFRALENFRRCGAKYLMATTYTNRAHNDDIVTGEWRPTNLQQPPFSFPTPIQLINEHCTEEGGRWADKSLGLWRIQDLPSSGLAGKVS